MTQHIWDGDQIALELDGSGNVTNKYVRGINLIYAEESGAVKHYLFNGHGDVVQLTGTDGNATKSYDYDAFGNEKNPDAADTNVFRYCGEYFDKETGTIYLRARYYNPRVGRFISEDENWGEVSDPLSLNLYTYCVDNPILYVDPTGNKPIVSWILHTGDNIANTGLGAISWGVRKTGINKNFNVTTADIGGFILNMNKDKKGVFHADQNCWQQHFGYNDGFDMVFDFGSSMDKAKFPFEYGHQKLIFWAWKVITLI